MACRMKIVSTGYSKTPSYADPHSWLDRIGFYTGILEELAKRHEVSSMEKIGYKGTMVRRGVHYFFTPVKKPVARFPFRLHRAVKKLEPDVVLVNGLGFPLQVMQLRQKLGARAKIILIHRAERPFTGLKKWLQRQADKKVDAYWFSSAELGSDWIRDGIIADQRKVHGFFPVSSFFTPGNRETARVKTGVTGNPVYLWVGRLDDNKDPLTVVKAFTAYHALQPSATLHLIYQSDELLEPVKQLAAAHPGIYLHGKVDHARLQDWYNAADFFISGSRYESAGIAASEAMSCGCIPVLSAISSFRQLSGPGRCGVLFEPGDEQSLLSALVKTGEMDRETERAKTLAQFRREFSFEAIAAKLEALIASLDKM